MPSLRLTAISVFLVSTLAFGQSEVGTASVNGIVTDPSGAAVTGAKVTASNTGTGLTRTTQTSDAGLYTLLRLPVGTYDITVEANGFKTAKKTAVPLSIGAMATIDVPLEIGATQETVSVTAEVPVVETTRSQTSTVVTEKAVAELPVNGRNFLDFTLLTPGVSRDYTRNGDISFGGQRGTSNSLLVDGADSNNVFFGQSTGRSGTGRNPYSFSQDAVQEFQVNTNGYAAEIGRAGGGVVNVITKSGTNDLHGTLFEFFRDKSLNANTWANNKRGAPKRAYHYNQFGGNAGGPIVKNRIFFFFDYDGQRNTTPNPVFLQVAPPSDALSQQALQELTPFLAPYSNTLNNDVFLGKVDLDITSSQRLSVRYNANRFKGANFENSGPNSAAQHTGNSDVSTDNLAANYTAVLTPKSVFESRFVFTRDNEPGASNATTPEAQIRQAGTLVLQIGRNNFSPRYTNARTYQAVESLSYVTGRHTLKFGVDIDSQKIDNFFPGNFSGSFQFNSYADFAARRAASFTQGFAGANTDGPLTRPNVNEYAFYGQDSWRATDRLTLNYGVRYDLFGYAQPPVKNPDSGLAALKLDTSRINPDHNNVGGRFGFAYRLSKTGQTTIRGGYGMYYGRTPSILTGTAFSQNGIQVQTYTLTSNIPTYPNILSAPPALSRTPDIYVFAPDYVQPLTHQFSFNFETQLAKDYALTIGYLGVRGVHLTRTRDVNLLPSLPVTGTFADGTPVTYYRHPDLRPNPNFRRISVFDSGADSIYHGGFIQVSKRFAQNFQLQASYTLSKVIDTNPDQTSVVIGGGDDGKVAQDTLLPNLDRGLGNGDVRHRFVFSGLWDINYAHSLANPVLRALLSGYQLSTIANVQSGRFLSATVGGNSDVNNDGNTRNDRPPYEGRNIFKAPGITTVDLRVSRDIPLYRERARLRLMFEAFNVANHPNFGGGSAILTTQYNFAAATRVFTPVPTFLTPTDTLDPRILQLAAKITF
jgi:outer membrane receptor protein involved in Fe transport